MSERTAPHDIATEKAVLGALLINPSHYGTVSTVLSSADFFRDAHKRIYAAIRELANSGTAIDLLTVKTRLQASGELDEVGGPAYLSSLTDGIPKSSNVSHYAAIVREHARLREIIFATNTAMAAAYDSDLPAAEVIEKATRALSSISITEHIGAVHVGVEASKYVTAIAEGTAPVPIPTGFSDLDRLVRGFRPRDLIIIAARPSVGKTAFALNVADRMAQAGKPGLFFSLEVDLDRLSAQLIGWRSRVPTASVESGDATGDEYGRVHEAVANLATLPLYLEDSAYTVNDVWGATRKMKIEHNVEAVFVDYLQLMGSSEKVENREREVALISKSLKMMAKELDVTVVALSQLGRAPEGRRDKRPQLSDLRESGALEQDADMALLLFRAEMYGQTDDNAGIAEVIVGKNRSGPTGVVKLAFLKELARFDNLMRAGD